MCLPVKCLKSCIYFSTMITIIVALTSIGFGIYQLSSNSSNFWDQTNWKWGQNSSISLIILGAFLLLVGIFGLWGGCKRNKCCLCLYNIGTMPLFLVFLILGIVVSVLVPKYIDDINEMDSNDCKLKKENKDLDWIIEANENSVAVQEFFGQAGGCEIYLTNSDIEQYLPNSSDTDSSLPTSAGKCNQIHDIPHGNDWVQFFEFMENTFECSGMCNEPKYYMYSNVNNKPLPTGKCFHKLKDFLEDYGEVTYIVAYCVALFLFVTIVFAFCLCCHPERKQNTEGGGIYHRMSYLDS